MLRAAAFLLRGEALNAPSPTLLTYGSWDATLTLKKQTKRR